MSEQTAENQQYMVNVSPAEEVGEVLFFTFMPKEPNAEHVPGRTPQRLPQFVVAVPGGVRELHFDWSKTPDVPEAAAREEIQSEVAARMEERWTWLDRVKALVDQVEEWAQELNWSTRRVEKGIDDARIGKHRVPALLLQEETCRALLEPVARSTPGAEGVVDLYLMPAYDDVAVFFYYNGRWNLHYNMGRGTNAVVPAPAAEAVPLSKEALGKVLAEMKKNAD